MSSTMMQTTQANRNAYQQRKRQDR